MNIEEARKEVENYLDYEGSISITAIATLYTAYEKEKEANKRLDKEAQGYLEELAGDGSMNIRRIQELEAELEKEKDKNKEHKQRITYLENKIFNQKQTIKEGGIKQC